MISRLLTKILYWFSKRGIKQYLESINFKDGKTLDVGCGYGYYSELFGKDYVGIDIDVKAIRNAKKNYPDTQFEMMDAVALNFPDQKFDLIFSFAVLHHLTNDQLKKTLREIARVIKDGGNILLVDIILPRRFKWLAYPLFWFDKGAQMRNLEKFSDFMTEVGLKILFSRESRFLNVGTAVVSAIK